MKKLIYFSTIISIVGVIFFGAISIALAVGVYSILIGSYLITKANLNVKTLLLIAAQVLFISIAFGLVYHELGISILNSITLSFQNVFHVSIITTPPNLETSNIYKIMASFESFIGYLLIVSGVSLLVKK